MFRNRINPKMNKNEILNQIIEKQESPDLNNENTILKTKNAANNKR